MTSRVSMFFLGGTISMSADGDSGALPTLGAKELIAAVPALEALDLDIIGETIAREQSGSLTFDHLLTVLKRAQADTESVGFVLVQGTDTLEESAYFIDLLWDDDRPFIVTGAMRNPSMAGADGSANMLTAVTAAASPALRELGAIVAFADELHAARYVTKTDTSSLTTFASPSAGPIGRVLEGHVHVLMRPERLPALWMPEKIEYECPIVHLALGLSEKSLRALAESSDALVIAGYGAGHVPGWWAPVISEYVENMPIVMTSRTTSGPALTKTYGAVGAEIDLQERFVVMGGYLSPEKARLITVIVMSMTDRGELDAAIRRRGEFL